MPGYHATDRPATLADDHASFADELVRAAFAAVDADLDPTDYTPRFEPSEADRAWWNDFAIDRDARLEFEALEAWLADMPDGDFDPWQEWDASEIQAAYGRTA